MAVDLAGGETVREAGTVMQVPGVDKQKIDVFLL